VGERAFVAPLTVRLAEHAALAPYAKVIATTIVAAAITYFSVVVGELVPKRLGLLRPEASPCSSPADARARDGGAAAGLALSASSGFLLRLLRIPSRPSRR